MDAIQLVVNAGTVLTLAVIVFKGGRFVGDMTRFSRTVEDAVEKHDEWLQDHGERIASLEGRAAACA